jgi:hypothetical protein
MRKNWILWKRSLCMSICEIFCPLILFALMVLARSAIKADNIAMTSYVIDEYEGRSMFIPTMGLEVLNEQQSHSFGKGSRIFRELNEAEEEVEVERAVNLFRAHILDPTSQMSFFPTACKGAERMEEDNYLISVSPKPEDSQLVERIIEPIEEYLGLITFLANLGDTIEEYESSDDPNGDFENPDVGLLQLILSAVEMEDVKLIADYGNALPKRKFEVKGFDTFQEMNDYTTSEDYLRYPEKEDVGPGICFGFALEELQPAGYEVKMFYSDSVFLEENQNVPFQLD